MARMRYVVTGGTGFIGRRVVPECWPDPRRTAVRVLVRRESLARFERLAQQLGRPRAAPGRRPDRARPRAQRRDPRRAGRSTTSCTARAIYDITAGDGPQRAANVDGTRAVIALARGLDATLHHVSSIAVAGNFHGVFTERRFRRRTGASDARITRPSSRPRSWCGRPTACGTGSTGPRWSSATPAPARWTRSTARTTSSACWPARQAAAASPRSCCPTPAAPTSCPSTTWPTPSSTLMHVDGRDGQTFHLDRAAAIGPARHLPRRRQGGRAAAAARLDCPAAAADPFLTVTGRGQDRAQHGGHPTRHPRRDPRRRRPGADVHLPSDTAEALRGTGIDGPASSRRTRRSCGAYWARAPRPRPGAAAPIPAGRWWAGT